MPKMKSSRAAAKRFTFTGTGRVRYKKMNKRHILSSKSTKRKRQLRNDGYLANGDAENVKRMLPYGN
jgi:large subunit ribosomal protein L35